MATATVTALVLVTLARALSWNEALSGVFGSISLATWVFLLVPQLILNYTTGSADGISLAFLTVWLMGDVANLAGALWAGLVPTVIALAVYFCFADFVLISQCLFYNHLNARREALDLAASSSRAEEESPLLAREHSNESVGLPGSRRHSSARLSHSSGGRRASLTKILEDDDSPGGSSWKRNILSILMVIVVGTAGWAIAWRSGVWTPTPQPTPKQPGDLLPGETQVPLGASVLGYFSALCYLGARIPQILKNYKDRSCEGLSLLFFVLSLMGNITYGVSILFHSLERDYIITNLPWLIGSLGTIVEDIVIFVQFRIYSQEPGIAVTA